MGDMVVPYLENREALAVEAAHFVECVRDRREPLANGEAGMRVVRILEAAQQSLRQGGQRVLVPAEQADAPKAWRKAA
jgi:predicted dehydrogenase